jgi:hypothetical protein
MSQEIVKSEYKVYYSRMARAYYFIANGEHHYFTDKATAQTVLD